MRLMAFVFLCLTFLAGVTVGTVTLALVNIIVFMGLALLAERTLAPRFGRQGLAFGMAGAFFVSFLWPIPLRSPDAPSPCPRAGCPDRQPRVTVTLSPAE